ncbi:MFS transporter [Alkalihalobacillus sp. MEB130]|uniref:MFS transporter n=1 Tax=Alkalihalobacillus sp. MEB130 TaxID=2976704 RepID=UPI0028DE9692|nr:MFS transporter [Alkalihalobacillus sp. MEB130]MDT8861294.1 MFS transporter [Alkalihalobacillus sp. MEB130]
MSIVKTWRQETNYQSLFWAGIISGIGNRISQVVVLALLYQLTGSGMAIGMVLAIRMLPFLLLAPLGGILADRFSRKKLLIIIDLVRIPMVLSLLLVQEQSDLWIIYVSTFLLASGEALYAPTRMSSIPVLVKQERLIDVNSMEQAMVGMVLVIGASVGGFISHYLGVSTPFILNGVTFLLSAMILYKIKFPVMERYLKKKKDSTMNSRNLLWGSSALSTFFFIAITMPLANGIDNVLISVYALEVFEMGEIGVGFMYASLGLGFIISSLFSNLLKRGLLILIVLFIALEGIGHMLLSIVPTFLIALIVLMFITFVGGISNICIDTVMMKVIPNSKRGTFFGLMQAISNTALGLSMASAGFLLEVYSPRELSFIVGFAYIGFTLFYSVLFSRLNLVFEKRELLKRVM